MPPMTAVVSRAMTRGTSPGRAVRRPHAPPTGASPGSARSSTTCPSTRCATPTPSSADPLLRGPPQHPKACPHRRRDGRGDAAPGPRGRLTAVAQFNGAAKECHALGDHGSAAIFEEMVRDEETHADWFESTLDAIERIGVQQYLAQQMEPGSAP